ELWVLSEAARAAVTAGPMIITLTAMTIAPTAKLPITTPVSRPSALRFKPACDARCRTVCRTPSRGTVTRRPQMAQGPDWPTYASSTTVSAWQCGQANKTDMEDIVTRHGPFVTRQDG